MNKDLIMYISYLCYELYKIDWKYSHGITKEKEMNSIKGYYRSINNIHDMDYNTYDEYLEELGFDADNPDYDGICDSVFLNYYKDGLEITLEWNGWTGYVSVTGRYKGDEE